MVFADSPAEKAGLRGGDALTALNGVAYSRENEKLLKEIYAGLKPGETVTYSLNRGGKSLEIEVLLGHLPESVISQWVGQHLLEYHSHPGPAGGKP